MGSLTFFFSVELLELVRSKPKLSTELRALTVTLAYFRGKKTYYRLCPGGVAGNLRNKIDLCGEPPELDRRAVMQGCVMWCCVM